MGNKVDTYVKDLGDGESVVTTVSKNQTTVYLQKADGNLVRVDSTDIGHGETSEKDPWFLSALSSGHENAVGTLMHQLPQSRLSDGIGHGVAGVIQRAEQYAGQVLLGNVNGKSTPILQKAHAAAARLDLISRDSVVEAMKNNRSIRTIAYALFQGHIDGLRRYQEELADAGRGTALIAKTLDSLDINTVNPTSALPVELVATVNLLYATTPDTTREEVGAFLVDHALGSRVLDYQGRLAVPETIAEASLFTKDRLDCEPMPDISHNLLRRLDPFRRAINSTTYARLSDFVDGDSEATVIDPVQGGVVFEQGVVFSENQNPTFVPPF